MVACHESLNVGVPKQAEVAVPAFRPTTSPAKIVGAPEAAPLTLTIVGAFAVGASQVAFTVLSAVPLWPLPDTVRRTA